MSQTKKKENKKKDDDSPRFRILDCKLCGASFEEHSQPRGGLVTRKIDDLRATLTDDLRIVITDKCVAAIWVDFNTKRIFAEEQNESRG